MLGLKLVAVEEFGGLIKRKWRINKSLIEVGGEIGVLVFGRTD